MINLSRVGDFRLTELVIEVESESDFRNGGDKMFTDKSSGFE